MQSETDSVIQQIEAQIQAAQKKLDDALNQETPPDGWQMQRLYQAVRDAEAKLAAYRALSGGSKERKTQDLHVRIRPSVVEKLQELARIEDRSVAATVEALINRAWEARKES